MTPNDGTNTSPNTTEELLKQALEIFEQTKAPSNPEARRLLHIAARSGNSEAQRILGLNFYHGIGVKKDLDEAFRWTKKAAEKGSTTARIKLGHMYRNGDGTVINFRQATQWWRKVAEQGNLVIVGAIFSLIRLPFVLLFNFFSPLLMMYQSTSLERKHRKTFNQ